MTNKHTTSSLLRRFSALLVLSLGILGLNAVPASAAPPVDFTETITFDDVNPCTGQDMEVTIEFGVREKVLGNGNIVAHVVRTGSTSDGYTMRGVETFVFNGNVARGNFSDMLRSSDGSAFRVSGHFVDNIGKGEIVVDAFDMRCLGG